VTIGKLFHVIHLAEALGPLDAFYDEVFEPWHGMMDHHFLEREYRMGSLLVVADTVVETVAPSEHPEAASAPVGRFFARFGRHWHSLAFYCDDVGEVYDRLVKVGVRVFLPGGRSGRPEEGDIYTHPRDTSTQLEFYQPPASVGGPQGSGSFPDPRFTAGWEHRWAERDNALGIERLSHATVVVADVERAGRVYLDGVGATFVHEESSALTGTRSVFVAVGTETVIELAQPLGSEGLAAADLAANGDMCHALTFAVTDLARTLQHLEALGLGVVGRDEDTVLVDPQHTWGAPVRFTTRTLPGDPRAR
jgi:Glyoxalase/Bleomycin resistance protein/Dioxygenase superfamily